MRYSWQVWSNIQQITYNTLSTPNYTTECITQHIIYNTYSRMSFFTTYQLIISHNIHTQYITHYSHYTSNTHHTIHNMHHATYNITSHNITSHKPHNSQYRTQDMTYNLLLIFIPNDMQHIIYITYNTYFLHILYEFPLFFLTYLVTLPTYHERLGIIISPSTP